MTEAIILLGTSNPSGETVQAVLQVMGEHSIPMVDLSTLEIGPFDYSHLNQGDDFLPLMEEVVKHDIIVLATPVYWYTMSATLKLFIDRISDLYDLRQDLLEKLKGKRLFVIASYATSLPRGFEDAFEQTCAYLSMHYLGTSFIYSKDKNAAYLDKNKAEIEKARRIILNRPNN